MRQCQIALLTDRGVLRVAGPGARAFLQGLITNDIGKAEDGTAIHAGLLTPQGKILFDFFVLADGEGYLLDCAKAQADALKQRLGFYRLRAPVKIEAEPSLAVAAVWGKTPPTPEGAHLFADPRLPALGLRLLVPAQTDLAALGYELATEADYHAHRIELGVPEGGRDYAFGDAFPHEALFDQLNGVDFEKGCFVGQEVVSRMEHRGTARKRIVGIEGEGPLPAPGADLTVGAAGAASGNKIGTLGSVHGRSGLALIRLDRAEEAKAAGNLLQAGDVLVSLRIPAWARFKTPAPATP